MNAQPTVEPYRVPRICPGGTVVCLGGGPSLTAADVESCRGKATVIAVNDGYRLAPWADAIMASDAKWWAAHRGVSTFAGLKFCLEGKAAIWPGVIVLRNTGDDGLELDPSGLRTGKNSGAAAINLAVHFGASRVLLLGYDCQAPRGRKSHWFGDHPVGLQRTSPFMLFRHKFALMAKPLRDAGVRVINCSRETAIESFPRQSLAEALP